MRDEGPPRRVARARRVVRIAVLGLAGPALLAAPARAQSLRGFARVQYESQDQRGGPIDDVQWWTRTVRLDYATKIRDRIDLTAQGEWNDLSYIDRADRQVTPRGSLRLAHRDYGAFLSYRPLRTTDASGATTRQRETTITGYWTRAGLPRVQASYIRRFQFRRDLTPEQTGTQKSVNASHQFGALQLRGSFAHLAREAELAGRSRSTQVDWNGGAQWSLARARSSALLSYDAQTSRRSSAGGPAQRTTVHSAAANGSRTFTRRLSASLVYGYRRSQLADGERRTLNDHEGSSALHYQLTTGAKASSGIGVRTARIEERLEAERYAFASLTAQGPIRPRWTGAAGVTRSLNWLPGESSRPVDAAYASTQMTLRPGLEITGQAQVTAGRAPAAVADTSGRRVRVTAQTGAGITATPLRPVTIRYYWTQYRTGESLFDPDATSRSDSWDARWNPVRSIQFSGNLSRTHGLGPNDETQTTKQATGQWSPNTTLQVSGTYVRSESGQLDPITQSLLGREVYGLRVLASLLREWRAQASINDIDPGRASHVRQWSLSLTRNFGR